MGLFSKSDAEPLTYPPVDRTVHVPARRDAVVAHLTAYSRLWSPKRAEQHGLLVGAVGGWTAIRLPAAVHPWQLHNLAYWMLDCPGRDVSYAVIAESAASPDHPAYRLVRDPEVGDALCGWGRDGQGWTVQVPLNRIVRGERVPVPPADSVPTGHHDWRAVPVMLEDPGPGMNEHNESNAKNRKALVRSDVFAY